jgi:hypothetical protein
LIKQRDRQGAMGTSGTSAAPLVTLSSSLAHWKIQVAVAFYFNMVGFILGNWVARIPSVKDLHNLDDAMFGLVLVTALVGACLCLPIITPVISKYGSCFGVLVGCVLY